MTDQEQLKRSKAEASANAAFTGTLSGRVASRWPLRALAVVVILTVFCVVGIRWLLRAHPSDPPATKSMPKVEVPLPAADPNAALPHASEANPRIASQGELARPWSSKSFFYQNRQTGENIPALLIYLPVGPPSKSSSYWALAMKAPFSKCNLEYVTDLNRLKTDYGFKAARYPMVGDPCSRTLFDPLKMMNLPGSIWVRGAIAQGSDQRPPLGIEVKIVNSEILAMRMESEAK